MAARALRFVDTHCNIPNILQQLKLPAGVRGFRELVPLVDKLKPASSARFEACLSVASDAASQEETFQLMSDDNAVFGAFGIHPLYAEQYTEACEKRILEFVQHRKCAAWGETGLDYHVFDKVQYAPADLQKRIFEQQMKHAVRLKKPIIIHTREAEDDTLRMMTEHIPADWKLHVHCFTDSAKFARDLMAAFRNAYFGFTGVITFKNADAIQAVVKEIPLDRLLFETDGPFMAPIPFRGKVCHPGHVPVIAEKIAAIKQVPLDDLYTAVRANTKDMFGI